MALMLSKVYDALRSAQGVSEEQAKEAAAELAEHENRFARLESDMRLLKWMIAFNLAGTVTVLWFVFELSTTVAGLIQ